MATSLLQRGLMASSSHDGADAPAETLAAPQPPASLAEVYDLHAGYVFRCLRSLGVREGLVDDAVQDVFLVVHDKLASFDGQAKLRTWLYAIVIRVARRYRERQARARHGEADEQLADERSAEQQLLTHEQLTLARLALAQLSDEQREVFVLAEVEQMSAPEIAAITGAPLNTVYSRLRSARLQFDKRVQQLTRPGRSR